MRTVVETLNIFKFEELSEGAKNRAFKDFQTWGNYPWEKEAQNSWNAFEEIWDDNYMDYTEKLKEDVEFVFNDYVNNNKDFTGYCMDYTIIEVIRQYLKDDEDTKPHQLFNKIKIAFDNELEGDIEHYYGEENFAEMAESNKWEFLQDGRMYKGGEE